MPNEMTNAETQALFALLVAMGTGHFEGSRGDERGCDGETWQEDLDDGLKLAVRYFESPAAPPFPGDIRLMLPLARRLAAMVRSEALADGLDIAREHVDLDQGHSWGSGGASIDWRDAAATLRAAQDAGAWGYCRRSTGRLAKQPIANGLCETCRVHGEADHAY